MPIPAYLDPAMMRMYPWMYGPQGTAPAEEPWWAKSQAPHVPTLVTSPTEIARTAVPAQTVDPLGGTPTMNRRELSQAGGIDKPNPIMNWLGENKGNIGDWMTSMGAGLLAGKNPQEGLALAGQHMAANRPARMEQRERDAARAETKKQTASTVAWLREAAAKNPAYQAVLAAVEGGSVKAGDAWSAIIKDQLDRANPTAQNEESFFGNPIPYETTNPDGTKTITYGQLGNRGTFRPVEFPSGATPIPQTRIVNTETEQLTLDPLGNVINRQPINNRDAARDTALGTGEANAATTALATAPRGIDQLTQMSNNIQGILDDPKLPAVLGVWGIFEEPLPGSEEFRVWTNINRLTGQAFLLARESLKGQGPLTDYESQQATNAILNLNRKMRPEDYRVALEDLNRIVRTGLEREQARLSQAQTMAGTPAQAPGASAYNTRIGAPSGGQTTFTYNPVTGKIE